MSARFRWPDDLTQEVIDMLAAGKTTSAIAASLGMPYRRVEFKVEALRRSMDLRPKPSNTTVRACMCCREPFDSEGPHHRLCDACRTLDVSPYEP